MNTITALFYVFSAVLLFASFRVITARSTVHAALFLVLAFFNARASGCCCAPSSWPSRWCWSTWAR
jgi:NADH:ubiquinone oxidoreductase subunit 6 (subunit J)